MKRQVCFYNLLQANRAGVDHVISFQGSGGFNEHYFGQRFGDRANGRLADGQSVGGIFAKGTDIKKRATPGQELTKSADGSGDIGKMSPLSGAGKGFKRPRRIGTSDEQSLLENPGVCK